MEQPEFGNWIRLPRVVALLVGGTVVLAAGGFLPGGWQWLAMVPGAAAAATGIFLLYVYYQFDDRGGGVQRQLWKMTLDHLHGRRQGRALDVGTGNGSLAVVLAMENASLEVIGVDLWGAGWAYSLADCVRNAARAGVAERVGFVRASADDLPFDDGEFDNVVSHFVFHEVSSQTDKRELIREALRVLKPGGFFSFHDMFLDARLYGVPEELPALLRSWGVRSAELVDPGASLRVPRLLLGKRVLGNCAILHGRK